MVFVKDCTQTNGENSLIGNVVSYGKIYERSEGK